MPSHIIQFGTLDMTDAISTWEQTLETRLNLMQVQKRHGALVSEAPVLSVRMIRVSGRTQHMTDAALRDTIDLMERILNSGRQKLRLHDDRFIYAYKQTFAYAFIPGGALTAIDFKIDFVCDDPFWYATTSDEVVQTLTTGDVSLGGGQYRKGFALSNDGSAFVYPIITVLANQGVNVSRVVIRNLTHGRTFQWTGTLLVGNSLVINPILLTVLNNGVEDLAGFNGIMPSLDVGTNNMEIEGQPARYTFGWTKRYF